MKQHELELAVQRVRELHFSTTAITGETVCYECTQELPVEYPCPTIKALDGKQ